MQQARYGRSRRGLGLLVAVTLSLGLTGCGLVSSGDGAAAAAPVASTAPIPPTSLVNLVALSNVDVDGTLVVVPMKGGTKVKGHRTLDYCAASFSTEKHRAARRQVVVNLADGTYAGLSNEVVAYDTEEQATKALEELRAAVKACSPKRWVRIAPRATIRMTAATARTSTALPVPDNAVVEATMVLNRPHRTAYLLQVFQRHGVVLDIFYAGSSKPFTKKQVRIVMSFAEAGGQRLAAT